MEIPGSKDDVSLNLCHMEKVCLWRNLEASRNGRELSSDIIFLEALDPAVPKARPTSGLLKFCEPIKSLSCFKIIGFGFCPD